MLEPLSLLNLLITVCVTIGGIVAYYHGFTRTAHEVQERVIHALQSEIQTLHDRISTLEHENTRLDCLITALCSALKQHGIHITIDGDMINIHDYSGTSTLYHARIYGSEASNAQEQEPQGPLSHPSAQKTAKKRGKKSSTPQEET